MYVNKFVIEGLINGRWRAVDKVARWHGAVMCTNSHLFGGVGSVRVTLGRVIQCHLPSFWSRCFWKRGPLSPFARSPAALLRVLHRPDQSQRAERRVLVGCWWVGYNSSPERDEALSQSLHSPASPPLCAEKGFSCFTIVWVIVWLETTVFWCFEGKGGGGGRGWIWVNDTFPF